MTTVAESTYILGPAQADGRILVTERHALDDGRALTFEYLADETVSPDLVLEARAARIATELAVRAASVAIASAGGIPYTHREFRKRLTLSEQVILDNFDVAEFAAVTPKIQALTVEQRASVRTALATYREAMDIRLDDPDTIALVTMFEAYGLWDSPGRAAEILNG